MGNLDSNNRGPSAVGAPTESDFLTQHKTATNGAALLIFAICMLMPLWLVRAYTNGLAADVGLVASAGGITIGIAAIFRSISRNLLRTSFGVVARTTARAISRHWTDHVVHWIEKAFNRDPVKRAAPHEPHTTVSIVVGLVGTAMSYCGVLLVVPTSVRGAVLGDIPLSLAGFIAIVPLTCYFGLVFLAGRLFSVNVVIRTELDGLVLQLYFTLAGSFLPLLSDGEYDGTPKRKAHAALFSLGGLLAIHLVLHLLAIATASPFLGHLASVFLLYAFVLSLPLHPLDGSEIWTWHKGAWALFFAAVLAAFNLNVPEVFYAII